MNNKIVKFLNTLKNASLARKENIIISYNASLIKCVEALYKEGLILSYSTIKVKEGSDISIAVKLRKIDDIVLTSKLTLVSKPTNIKHLPYHEICRLTLKEKTGFFFTNKGILTLEECKQQKVGGVFSFYS